MQPELGALISPELMRDITSTRLTLNHVLEINSQNMAARPYQKGNQIKDIAADATRAREAAEANYDSVVQAADAELERVIAEARAQHAAIVGNAEQDKQSSLQQVGDTWSSRTKEMNEFFKKTEQDEVTTEQTVTTMLDRFNGYVVDLEQGTVSLADLRLQRTEAQTELQTLSDQNLALQDEFVAKNAQIATSESEVASKRESYQAEEHGEQQIAEQVQKMHNQISELQAGLQLLETKRDQTQHVHGIYVQAKSKLDALCKERGQLLVDMGNLAAPMVELRERIKDLDSDISTAEGYVAQLTAKITEIIDAANRIVIHSDTDGRAQDAPNKDIIPEVDQPMPQPVALLGNSVLGVLTAKNVVQLVPRIRQAEADENQEQAL